MLLKNSLTPFPSLHSFCRHVCTGLVSSLNTSDLLPSSQSIFQCQSYLNELQFLLHCINTENISMAPLQFWRPSNSFIFFPPEQLTGKLFILLPCDLHAVGKQESCISLNNLFYVMPPYAPLYGLVLSAMFFPLYKLFLSCELIWWFL
jgi:hypothetical protein